MELRLLPLISYLAATTYLMAWTIRQSWRLQLKIRAWWFQRQAAGRILSLRASVKSNNWSGVLLTFAEAIFGMLAAPWVVSWISREWLLLVLVALAILSEELRPSHSEMNLLAVVVLMDRVRVYSGSEGELFEMLAKALHELPDGEVQQELREALQRRRSGLAAEGCLAILRGINPYFDELILTVRHLNWQTGPALIQVADRLHQRAARRWDRASRFMLLKDRTWPYLSFIKIVVVGSIIVLSIQGVATRFTAWPGRITVLLCGLAWIAAGLFLYLVISSEWLRRILVLALLLLAFIPAMNTINIQSPWWIQIHTITDVSDNLSDSKFGNSSDLSQELAQTRFQNSIALESSGLNNQPPTHLPIPTLFLIKTKIGTPLNSTPPISSEVEFEKLCCHRIYHPK